MILIFAFMALQLTDIVTTNLVLAGGGYEANPFVAAVQLHRGVWWWVPKLLLAAAACLLLLRRHQVWAILSFVVLMLVIVINNLYFAISQSIGSR
jgi:hypothetical protein